MAVGEKMNPAEGRPQVLVIMGVSGSGKTSIGVALSSRLGWDFYDGDDFHPPENVAKMARGEPLNDQDRAGWLAALHDLIAANIANGVPIIVASSALKQKYRDQLKADINGMIFIYLRGSYDLIFARMQARPGHYMKAKMLQSQFDTLEAPKNALTIDIDQNVDTIVDHIIEGLWHPSG